MTHRKVKRRKINPIKVIICFLVLYIIGYLIYGLFTIHVKNIYIINNNLVSDQSIIDSGKLTNYPSFFLLNLSSVEKNILANNKYIKKVTLKKKFWFELEVKVTEYEPLFINGNKELILSNNTVINNYQGNLSIPTLLNYVPSNIYKYFIEQYMKIDKKITRKISEIKYEPNDIDKGLFFFTMNDGNYVYLTLYKFEKINSYTEIISTFENKKGILYLDSGNYFKIFK